MLKFLNKTKGLFEWICYISKFAKTKKKIEMTTLLVNIRLGLGIEHPILKSM